MRMRLFLLFILLCIGSTGGCDGEILLAPCGPSNPCPDGLTCLASGSCVASTPDAAQGKDGVTPPDLKASPDLGCPSGILCGQPALCCKAGQECVESKCLPACPSGVRCLSPKVLCCSAGKVCLSGACATPGKLCKDSFDSPPGYFCEPTLGRCLPQPTGAKCEVKPVVVPANDDQIVRDKCTPPGTRGIRVFGDSADKWVRTRPVWNQHTYHITNVGSTGAIPAKEQRNWDQKGLNNFRQNVQGAGVFNAPDLTSVGLSVSTLGCPKTLSLRARVANMGSLGVKAGIKVSFYEGTQGKASTLLKTVVTTKALLPGTSELLIMSHPLQAGKLGPFNFWVRADDDGTGKGAETECREDNNVASITGVKCPLVK